MTPGLARSAPYQLTCDYASNDRRCLPGITLISVKNYIFVDISETDFSFNSQNQLTFNGFNGVSMDCLSSRA